MTTPEPLTPEALAVINRARAVCTDWAGDPDFGPALDPLTDAVTAYDAERAARRGFWCYTQGHGDPDRCVEHGDIPRTQSIANHIQSAHGLTYEQYLAQRPEDAPDHIPAYRAARQTPEDQP